MRVRVTFLHTNGAAETRLVSHVCCPGLLPQRSHVTLPLIILSCAAIMHVPLLANHELLHFDGVARRVGKAEVFRVLGLEFGRCRKQGRPVDDKTCRGRTHTAHKCHRGSERVVCFQSIASPPLPPACRQLSQKIPHHGTLPRGIVV